MTAVDRDTLKTYFETGDRPTQTQFGNFIDSALTLSASLGTPIHSSACLQTGSPLTISQSGSVITHDITTQSGSFAYVQIPTLLLLSTIGTILYGASTVTVARFYLPHKIRVSSIHFFIVTPCDGGFASAGIYNSGGGSLLINSTALLADTSGVKSRTLPAVYDLDPGYYIQATTSNVQGIAWVGQGAATNGINTINASVVHIGTAANNATNGSLPNTLGTLNASISNVAFCVVQS